MCDTKQYSVSLERKLIDEFKQKFEDKLGYRPVVLTKFNTEPDNIIPLMSLEELATHFEPFLPVVSGKKLQLGNKNRIRELVELRNIFCALARMMRFTCKNIGSFLGGRDHTTVIHNVMTFTNLIETNDTFREKYIQILNYIKENNESSVMDHLDQTQCESKFALLS